MSIFVGDKKATLYHGDHHPAELWGPDPKGNELVRYAGYDIPKVSGQGRVEIGEQPYKASLPSVTVHGEGKQDKLEGKNLFDIKSLKPVNGTYKPIHDGFVWEGSYYIEQSISLKVDQTVIFNCESGDIRGCAYVYENGDSSSIIPVGNSYLLPMNIKAVRVYKNPPYGTVEKVTVIKPQLELGSTPTPYEPYCGGIPAPNPQYSIEPVFLEGASVVGRGRNLLRYPIIFYGNVYRTRENDKCTDAGNGTIICNDSGNGVWLSGDYSPGKYSWFFRSNQDFYAVRTFSVNRLEMLHEYVIGQYKIDNGYRIDLEETEDFFLFLRPGVYIEPLELYDFAIQNRSELASVPPYTPYYDGGTAPLPILRALPDGSVRDEMDVVSGTVVRRIGFEEFDGSENWTQENYAGGIGFSCAYDFYGSPSAYSKNFICNLLKASNNYNQYVGEIYLGVNSVNAITGDSYTLDSFKDILRNTPLRIWYVLATPIIEHYDPTILRQHPGYTQLIQQGGEMQAVIDAEYYKEVNG